MLKIRDLHVYYGGIHALKGISLDVPEGQIATLIGANGAGKSTTLRASQALSKQGEDPSNWKDAISHPGLHMTLSATEWQWRRKAERYSGI